MKAFKKVPNRIREHFLKNTVAFFEKSINMPAMMTLTDIQEQLEQIDQQLVKLIDERVRICDSANLGTDEEVELLSLLLEESAEKGLDEARMEKVGKLLIALCRGGTAE
jgi:chorismate mutase